MRSVTNNYLSTPVKHVAITVVVIAWHPGFSHEVRKFVQLERADARTVGEKGRVRISQFFDGKKLTKLYVFKYFFMNP